MRLYFFFLLHVFTAVNCTILNLSFDDTALYPITQPYHEDYLCVSEEHAIYYAQFGNPDGMPVIIVHGGPGAGCSNKLTALFDLSHYHVIMFDQRGAMRSKPFGCMRNNTPQASVQDMEKLRKHLHIDRWILFGGSYGSLLSLLYGQTHPERVLGFVLRGIFLGTKEHYNHLFYGMKKFFPEVWQPMVDLLPKEEQADLIHSSHQRLMDPDPAIHQPIAQAFMYYDILCAQLGANPSIFKKESIHHDYALSISRAFVHYSVHDFFLQDNQLLKNMDRIAHLPAIIVHGRYDLICPPQNAYDLYEKWPNATLWFIPDAGHSAYEPSISKALKTAMDRFKT